MSSAQAVFGDAELAGKAADRKPLLAIRSVVFHQPAQRREQSGVIVPFGPIAGIGHHSRTIGRRDLQSPLHPFYGRLHGGFGHRQRDQRTVAADRQKDHRKHQCDREQPDAVGKIKDRPAAAGRQRDLGRDDRRRIECQQYHQHGTQPPALFDQIERTSGQHIPDAERVAGQSQRAEGPARRRGVNPHARHKTACHHCQPRHRMQP